MSKSRNIENELWHFIPDRCVLYGIEGESFDPGIHLTASVESAVEQVAERIRDELALDNQRSLR